MFCGHCGTRMEKVERFCTECGKEQLQPEVNQGTNHQPTPDGIAVPSGESAPQDKEAAYQEPMGGGDNKKAIGIIATICAGLALLIGVGLFLIFGASDVEVPNLSNLTQDEAISLIEESRLTVGEITEEYSGRVEAGLVISQSPRSGREVERGTTVDLTISLGAELIEVPDFTDLELLDAADLIRELGLNLGDVNEEFSDTIDDGVVISQSISAGSQVEVGESIDLAVSLGPEFVTVIVPDLTGLCIVDAVMLLEDSFLQHGIIFDEYHEDIEEGLVIFQSPRAGTSAEKETRVDFTLSLGSPLLSVNPFDIDVWGEDQIITLELRGVSVDVPIPPWLNEVIYDSLYDEDYEFVDGVRGFSSIENAFYVVNRERDDLMTMVEVLLFSYTGDFGEVAEAELHDNVSFLSGLESISSITDTTIFYQSESELTAGVSSIEYSRVEDGHTFYGFELIRINHYNGIAIRTRLRLEMVNAPEDMCAEEFASAFGLWRYIDAGYMELD